MTALLSALIFVLCLACSVDSLQMKHFKKKNVPDKKNAFLKDSYNYFVPSSNNQVWAGALTLAWQ